MTWDRFESMFPPIWTLEDIADFCDVPLVYLVYWRFFNIVPPHAELAVENYSEFDG